MVRSDPPRWLLNVTDWAEAVALVAPQLVRIQTSRGWGTGFIHYGTSVPGCSGRPVFASTSTGLRIIGALTDYLPHSVASDPDPERAATEFLPGLSVAADVSDYKVVEDALSKLPSERRSLTIKLDQCPRCKAPIVEGPEVAHGLPVLVCQAGCGPLIDLLDNDFVSGIPGGRSRLAHILHQARAQVEAANAPTR